MSYEKVKSICIDEEQKKVFINCASNNCRPLYYTRQEYPYFSKILQEKGRQETEISLLINYIEGNLQEGKNKYSDALKVLRYVYTEEFKPFEYGNIKYKDRDKEEFKQLLIKALNYKIPKQKFIIVKETYNNNLVYAKMCLTCVKWLYSSEKATKYDFEKEAEDHIFNNYKGIWKVIPFKEEEKKKIQDLIKEVIY